MQEGAPASSPRDFLKDNAAQLLRSVQYVALCLPLGFASLFPADLFLTHLIVPLKTLLWVRGGIVLLHGMLAAAAYAPVFKRWADGFGVAFFLICAANILILTVLTGGSESPYNEAYVGAIFFMASFVPWRARYFVPAALVCAVTYPLALAVSGTLGVAEMWVPRVGCLAITCGLAIMSSVFLERLRRSAFMGRVQLEQALMVIQDQQRHVNADLDQARGFQRKLLRPLPVGEGLEFAALYTPADFLGGDYYEVMKLGPGWYRLFMADVTGHGTQAAMRTTILQQQLERASRSSEISWALLSTMNDAVLAAFGSMTVNYCALCMDFRKNDRGWLMTGTNAGLPEPAVAQQRGLSTVSESGTYQGIIAGVEYPPFERQLSVGDGIVAATDGVVDLLDEERGSLWVPDQARFVDAIQQSATSALDSLKGCLALPNAPKDRADDLTMVVVRVS